MTLKRWTDPDTGIENVEQRIDLPLSKLSYLQYLPHLVGVISVSVVLQLIISILVGLIYAALPAKAYDYQGSQVIQGEKDADLFLNLYGEQIRREQAIKRQLDDIEDAQRRMRYDRNSDDNHYDDYNY